jgi:hypothetical protein
MTTQLRWNPDRALPVQVGDVILRSPRHGYVVVQDVGVPSGALTYHEPDDAEWSFIESHLED